MTLLLFPFRPNKSTMCVHVQILQVINICVQHLYPINQGTKPYFNVLYCLITMLSRD